MSVHWTSQKLWPYGWLLLAFSFSFLRTLSLHGAVFDNDGLLALSLSSAPNSIEEEEPVVGNGQKENKEEKKPRLYIHVGPCKTGTTFLQCAICNDPKTLNALKKDNFAYIGTCPYNICGMEEPPKDILHHRFSRFLKHSGKKRKSHDRNINREGPVLHQQQQPAIKKIDFESILSPDLIQSTEQKRQLGWLDGALIFFEGLAVLEDTAIQALHDFLTPHWQVTILAVYRPLYQWLPSKYNSNHKPGKTKKDLSRWPTTTTTTKTIIESSNRRRNDNSNDENTLGGGDILRPFDLEDRDDFSQLVHYIESIQQHPVHTVMHNFKMYFEDVQVIPLGSLPQPPTAVGASADQQQQQQLTKIDPLFHHLFCNILPTSTTCEQIRTGQIGTTQSSSNNPSVSFNYDILAVAAFDQKLLNIPRKGKQQQQQQQQKYKRPKVRKEIQNYQEKVLNKTANDFELECLPQDTLDRLERLSLVVERNLYGVKNKTQEAAHRQGFLKAIGKKKFCWINANLTLQDPTWIQFFKDY